MTAVVANPTNATTTTGTAPAAATAAAANARSATAQRPSAAVRSLAAAVFVAICSLASTRVFQRTGLTWSAAVVVVPLGISLWIRSGIIRLIGYAAFVVASAMAASLLIGGNVSDAIDGLIDGWSKLLSTTWPSPLRPELGAFVVAAIAATAAVTAELASSLRWRAALLIPGTALGTGFVVLSAPLGSVSWGWLAAVVCAAAAVLVLASPDAPRLGTLAGESPVFGGAAVVLAVAIGGVSMIPLLERADPRAIPEANLERSTAVNPLAQVVAQRELVPAQAVMNVRHRPSSRLRLLALEQYDGVLWSFAPIFGSVGRTLRKDEADTVQEIEIEPVGQPLSWIPVSGDPVTINSDVLADPERSMLYADPPIEVGSDIRLSVSVPTIDDDLLAGAAALPPLRDELSDTLAVSAARLSGSSGGIYDRLRTMEEAMRTQYELDSDGPAGVNAGLMRYFIDTSRVGTEEQFVSAFTLLARSLGARARIAVGYLIADDRELVTTADARAWPEVWLDGAGWVAFNPVPDQIVTARPGAGARVGPGSVPIPPLAPPPQTNETSVSTGSSASNDGAFAGRLVRAIAITVALLGSFVLIGLASTFVVMFLKRRRRHRRLAAPNPSDRVVGAWAEATDTLVDYGASFSIDQTNHEVAREGASIAGESGRAPLADLADLADQAAHGRHEPDELTVAHALRLLGQIEQAAAERHRQFARWRARITTRSLARSGRLLDH